MTMNIIPLFICIIFPILSFSQTPNSIEVKSNSADLTLLKIDDGYTYHFISNKPLNELQLPIIEERLTRLLDNLYTIEIKENDLSVYITISRKCSKEELLYILKQFGYDSYKTNMWNKLLNSIYSSSPFCEVRHVLYGW